MVTVPTQMPESAVLVAGAGGHGRVVLDALLASHAKVLGILDPAEELWGLEMMGVDVLGDDSCADRFGPGAVRIAIGVIGFGPKTTRHRFVREWASRGYAFAQVTHPTAIISPFAAVEAGTQLLARSVVNPGARVAPHAIINTGAIVEHDCIIAEGAHLAPGVTLGGGVSIGPWAQVGLQATVLSGCTIGEGAIVGAGAVVVGDVAPNTLVVGVPARPRRSLA